MEIVILTSEQVDLVSVVPGRTVILEDSPEENQLYKKCGFDNDLKRNNKCHKCLINDSKLTIKDNNITNNSNSISYGMNRIKKLLNRNCHLLER